MSNEQEIRTQNHNLLLCKLRLLEDNHLVLELKNGKRTDSIPLETFVHEVNSFIEGHLLELHKVAE